MKNLLVHSSGYPRPSSFLTDADEMQCVRPSCKWSPSSLDFAAMGANSGGSEGVGTVAGLKSLLENQPKASIKELRLIGHSDDRMFSFGGTITRDEVFFTAAACLRNSDAFQAEVKGFQRLADRFAMGGKITLLGCNSGGRAGELLNFLNESFFVPVTGFKELIDYLQAVENRGRYRYLPLGQVDGPWKTNAWDVTPDAFSKQISGAPLIAHKARKAGGSQLEFAQDLMNDLLHNYFRLESKPTIRYYPATELSLATVVEEKSKFIEVSQGYINNLKEDTLHWRLRELRVAFDLLENDITRPISLQR